MNNDLTCGLHLNFENYGADQGAFWDRENSILRLPAARSFEVVIREYDESETALKAQQEKAKGTKKAAEEDRERERTALETRKVESGSYTTQQQRELKADQKAFEAAREAFEKKQKGQDSTVTDLTEELRELKNRFNGVRWIYQPSGVVPNTTRKDFNESFRTGNVRRRLAFPKVLEGGGPAYMEAFFYDPIKDKEGNPVECHPQNSNPFGCFISAAGTPKVVAAQWKDVKGKNLGKTKVAYGSTVYLHIYTEGLYGQNIKVQLEDTYLVKADLTLAKRDGDGDPIEPLRTNGPEKLFRRKVGLHSYNPKTQPQLAPPKGVLENDLFEDDANKEDGRTILHPNMQKCVFAVYIDPRWQFEGAGSDILRDYDNGDTLEIYPTVFHDGLAGGKEVLDAEKYVLTVSAKNATYNEKAISGNSPVLIGDEDLISAKDGRKRIDFTFGVFIDGTLNNKYNTLARTDWEDAQILKRGRDVKNPIDRLEVAAHSQKQVRDAGGPQDYIWDEDNSYDNDLDNNSILFQYYNDTISTETHKFFKVYTEGMGTNTLADGEQEVESYEADDAPGFGLGQGKSGIITRVKRAIQQMADKVKLGEIETIGTLTIHVFGFSRGAAAARSLINEVYHQPRRAVRRVRIIRTGKLKIATIPYVGDHNGNMVEEKYLHEDLPEHGWLGYLLTKKNVTFDNLVVRFAGLFDTVPHHGVSQDNDTVDLGLNTIAERCKYTVHLVAADEHRKNFSLVDLRCVTGKEGGGRTSRGVELYLPGVHCDVGGSYVEGRKEVNDMVSVRPGMDGADKKWLIEQGWYTKEQLEEHRHLYWGRVLKGTRPYLSNQYSFIPLYIMHEFALQNSILFLDGLLDKYTFTQYSGVVRGREISQHPGNVKFLKGIKEKLWAYAFAGGKPMPQTLERSKVPQHFEAVEGIWAETYTPEQLAYFKALEEKNRELKALRSLYLHFNANYHDKGIGAYDPRVLKDGTRKREVRG